MREVVVDGSALTVDDVVAVAHGQARVTLGADVAEADGSEPFGGGRTRSAATRPCTG